MSATGCLAFLPSSRGTEVQSNASDVESSRCASISAFRSAIFCSVVAITDRSRNLSGGYASIKHSVRLAGPHKGGTPASITQKMVISTGQFFLDSIEPSSVSGGFDCRDTRGRGTAHVGTPSRGRTQTCRTIHPPKTPSTVNMLSISLSLRHPPVTSRSLTQGRPMLAAGVRPPLSRYPGARNSHPQPRAQPSAPWPRPRSDRCPFRRR